MLNWILDKFHGAWMLLDFLRGRPAEWTEE